MLQSLTTSSASFQFTFSPQIYSFICLYIHSLNAKNVINNSYINFKVVFAGEISESFFLGRYYQKRIDMR